MGYVLNDLDFLNILLNIIHLNICAFIFILNSIILYFIINKLKLDSIELKFIFLLCLIEISFGIVFVSLAIIKLIVGYTFLSPNNTPCIFYGYICAWFVRFEYLIVCILALWRYLTVVHEYKISLKLLLAIFLGGISPTMATLIYGLVNMDARPFTSYANCLPLTSPGKVSTILNIIGTILLMLPCWVTTYCYFIIGWKVNKKLNLMKIEAKLNNNEVALRAIKSQKINLILQIFMIFILYNVDIMFSVVTYFMRLANGYRRPPFFDAVIHEMLIFTLAFNPIVTVSFQPEIKNEIRVIFIKLNAKIKKTIRGISTS
jgi:hypothetical protein